MQVKLEKRAVERGRGEKMRIRPGTGLQRKKETSWCISWISLRSYAGISFVSTLPSNPLSILLSSSCLVVVCARDAAASLGPLPALNGENPPNFLALSSLLSAFSLAENELCSSSWIRVSQFVALQRSYRDRNRKR